MASYADIKKRVLGQTNVEQEESEYQKIKNKVTSGYIKFDGIDDDYINSFLSDANDFIKRTQESLQGADWNSHSSLYDSWKSTRADLNSRADTIRSYLNVNKSRIGEEAYNGIMSYLKEYGKADDAAYTSWIGTKNYFSQWDTEKDYNDAKAALQDRTEKLAFDTNAGQAELDALRSTFDEYSKLKKERDSQYSKWKDTFDQAGYLPEGAVDSDDAARKKVAALDAKLAEFGDMSGAESTIASKTQYLNQAKKLQHAQKLVDDAKSDSDFEKYSNIGLNIKNPEDISKVPSTWFQDGEPVGNPVTMSRANADYIAIMEGNGGSTEEYGLKSIYRYMTNDEVAIYNYYLGKGDKAKADEYLASIEDSLNRQHGHVVAQNVDGNLFATAILAVGAGLDQFKSGIQNIGNLIAGEEADVTSPWQYASQEVRENLLDDEGDWTLGSVAYDLLNTTAHMAPTIVAGKIVPVVGPILGASALGASAMGNAYAEAVKEGYDKDQAKGYAVMVGVSEAGLQYVLGGISSLGGKASGGLISKLSSKAVSKISSGVGKAIASGGIKIAGKMVSEFSEEYLQEVLNPVFKNIAFNTNEDVELLSSEAVYAGILGALSAGLLEGIGTAAGEFSTYKAGKNIIQENQIDNIAELGKMFPEGTKAFEIASKVNENTDAYTLGTLLREAGASLTKENIATIQNELVKRGAIQSDAKSMAKWLNKLVMGGRLSERHKVALENNKILSEVFYEVVSNPSSTVNMRTMGYALLHDLAYEVAGAQNDVQIDPPVAEEETEVQSTQEPVENKLKVSNDGKTINTKTGEYVDVVGIPSSKKGELTLKVKKSDGSVETVNAKDLSFGNQNDALLYSMVMEMGVSADTAESIIKTFDPADGVSVENYTLGMKEAYTYGKLGIPAQEMSQEGLSAKLTEAQRIHAYKLGTVDANTETSEAQKKVTESKGKTSKKKGKVEIDFSRKNLSDRQKVSLQVLEKLSESLGVDFVVFKSYKGKDRQRYYKDESGNEILAPNGFYDRATGKIHIDIMAGVSGNGLLLFTAAHELTHYIKQWSPEKFKVLADFLMEQYGKKGQSVSALVREQIRKAKDHDRELSYEAAFEEVVADSMESMLADGNVAQKLSLLKAKDKSLFDKIKAFFDSLVKKIKEAYARVNPDSREGQLVAEMKDSIERLQELFTEGLADASENYQASEQVLAESGIAVDPDTDAGSIYSVRDVLSDTDRQKVAKALAERFGVTVDEAMNWLTAETSLASLILNPKYSAYLDYEGDASETAIKTNSDYPQGTVDFSNICPKRREFTQVMNGVLRNFPHHVFAATDLAKIRTIMGEEGMTLPCHICYVEDRRQLDTIVAQDFLDGLKLYREGSKTRPDGKPFNANQLKGLKLIDGDTYVPTIYELVTLEGRNSLKAKNPNMEAAWVKYNNARGMQSIRLLTNEAEYKRQILKYSKTTVKAKNDNGGLRIYSFSDAEMFHLIDIIQVITDSATVGLCLQGYTKINEYAKAVKDTGEKLNRSLIPKGELGYHIEDGKVVLDYDTVEGIDINSKDFFDNRDNPDVGNIVIGINDTQIRAAMVSDFIDQIIPFHTGQSDEVLGEKGIASWDNYKTFQKEKDLATGNASDHQINIYTEVIQAAAAEGNPIQNKRQFVEKFLAVCKENNLQPRFSQFLNTDAQGNYIYTEGYHKLLVDFKTFAQTEVGEYLPQMPVKPIFNDAYLTQLLRDYVKEQKVKDADVAKSMPKVIERITNEIVNADSDVAFSLRGTVEETADLVAVHNITPQQFAEALERNSLLAPSLAITNKGHTDFGDISLLFDKSTIDPSASAENKLYGADAWTPTQTKMKKNPKFDTNKTIKSVNNVKTRIGSKYVNELFDVSAKEFMDTIKKADGSIYDAYAHDLGMQAAYAKESKIISKMPTQKDGTVDTAELQKQLNAVLDTDSGWRQYKKWLANLSDTVITSYDAATNEDILRNMKAQPSTAKTFKLSVSGKLVVPAAEYSSIDDLRKNKNRLSENAEADAKKVASQFLSWAEGIDSDTNTVVDAINATFANRYSASDIVRSFNSKGIKISIEAARDLQVLYKQAVELPTQYFEAKPQREVGLEEIKAVVMPEQATYDSDLSEIRAKLEQLGIKVVEYKNGSKESRVDALNSVDDVKFSDRDYSYEALISKPDMVVTTVGGNVPSNRADVVSYAKKNAASIGKPNKDGSVSVHVDDIGTDVVLSTNGLKHGLDRRFDVNAPVTLMAGHILQHSIRINELTPQHPNASGSYVLLGAAVDNSGEMYVVRSVVNSFGNELASMDVLYAINTKKGNQLRSMRPGFQGPVTDSTISIADLLDCVNQYFPDILPEDVLKHYGHDARPAGVLGESALYSDRDPNAVSTRNLLANSLESAAQNDIERNKLRLYKEKIDLIESEEKKLTELRAEIKELSFAKGPRDTARIRSLQDEATRTANRINTYDKQLLTLEASKPLQNILQHEKDRAMKKQKQRDAENLRAYKEKAAATQRELLTRYQESRKNAVEGRHKTEMRHKIRNVVSELNKLLLNGTKERNVKLGLQPAVASALEAVNMDTIAADERIAKLEAEMLKSRNPDKIQEISRKIDNIRSQGDVMASRLEALRRAYADIKASSDNIPEHYRSEAALIADKVDSVMQQVGNTPLRNMNLSQLEAVHDLYKMVLTTVRNANALFKQGKLEDLQHNVSEIMSEVSALPVRKEERLKVLNAVESFSWNEMIPVYAFDRIGSKTLSQFFWEVVKGQNTFATDINEAKEFASATREKFGYDKWDTQKVHEFKLADGRTFRLTLKHMMSIYAYSKRAQALDHMRTGGFFFNDKETFRKKGGVLSLVKSNEEGYCVNEAVLSAIVGEMTQEQLHYVDAMQEYLTKMGEKGNEVSRVLWGIDIFKEKVYFPLKSSKDFIFQANQTAQEASLKNDGMTKEVKPGASNPIVLEAFDDVWASHVNRMSQYHSFVLPIENLNKIHNYGTWAGTSSVSVSTMLAARHGTAVNDYLTNFIRDLNGASSSQGASNPFISMVSKFKKTAVAASASVVVQQPTAVLRAMAVMDAKYFVGKPSLNWSEIKKYAPIAIIKEIGGFDAGAGRQATQWLNEDTLRGTEKVMNKIDDYSMKGAAYGDQLGWGAIWSAVKNEIKATTNLEVGSEEFMQKAGERFTEVIVLTQVYDSTLSRSGYMRSKHDSVKMLTAFMGEPTVSINMMYNAAVQAKRGNITKRKATRVLSAVYASVVAASAMASMVYALRDDDDDESYLEKFAEAFGDKLISDINPLNMLPAVRDVMSILEGWDVERSDVAIFQDIYSAFDSLDSDSKSAWRKIEDFAGAIAAVFGVPLKNALRTGREIYNGINDIFDGISPSGVGDAFVRGITGENKDKGESLYNAIVDGDTERLELYKKGYKDDSSYELAVRNALRENDPRIQEAAQARKDGDTTKYASLVREIVKEGHFSQDTVVKAVNNALTKLNKGESTSSGSEAGNKDASSIYYSSDLNQALEDGDTREALTIIEDMVKVKTENYINDGEKAKDAESKAKSSVKSSITSYWKPLYLEAYKKGNATEMARIRNLLYSTKLYGTANEVVKTAQDWVKDSK